MDSSADAVAPPTEPRRFRPGVVAIPTTILTMGFLLILASTPVVAQTVGAAFCQTPMAETIKNIFTLIQYGGPLLGGAIALGATVLLPAIRRADRKEEIKDVRNQSILYGVFAAPLGTVIVQFLLNNVVVGGTSCGF